MFKVKNKGTRTTPLTCIYCWLWTDFTHCSGDYIADFEQVNAIYVTSYCLSQNLRFTKRKNRYLLIEIRQFFSNSDYKWLRTSATLIGTFNPLITYPTKWSKSSNSLVLKFLTPIHMSMRANHEVISVSFVFVLTGLSLN